MLPKRMNPVMNIAMLRDEKSAFGQQVNIDDRITDREFPDDPS